MSELPIPIAIQADLVQVDALIRGRIQARPVVVQLVEQYQSQATHTQLRAALALLCAQLGQPQQEAAQHAAAAVELIQIAMQVHSDLLEPGGPAAVPSRARHWQGDATLMLGDYLLALAAVEMTLAPDQRVIAYYSRAVMAICEGRLAPVAELTPLERALEQYRFYTGQTEAALIAAACQAGAVCGGLDQAQIAALERFGHHIGMACRIASEVRASTTASAWRGQITLPLIYAVDADPTLATLLQSHAAPDNGYTHAVSAAVQRSGGVQRAHAEAQTYAQAAIAQLDGLPSAPARQSLVALARALV